MKIERLLIVWAIMLVMTGGPTSHAIAQGGNTSGQRQVRVYFPRDGNPHPRDPFNLQFVVRQVTTAAPARPALEALLAGPTAAEKRRRLRALDAGGLRVGALTISDGTARVDFVSRGGKRWAGDLSPAEFRQAVERTLKQFSTVRRVTVSVDGKTDFDSER
ncbi:MAG: GerMN domain-containing protein [Acidobacteria bacterium]|nr:GerMN domain-containing protein [Acidobacteriota bacterium]